MKKTFVVVILFQVLLFSGTIQLYSQNTKNKEQKRDRLNKEIELIDRQLQNSLSKKQDVTEALTLIRKKMSNRQELINDADKQISNINIKISSKQKDVNKLKCKFDTLTYYYSKLIRNAYKNRDPKIWFLYIMGSENIGQAFRRMGYFKNLSAQMNKQAQKIMNYKSKLEFETQKLQKLKLSAQQIKNIRLKEYNQLQKEENDSQLLISKLQKDARLYKKQLRQKRRQVAALNKEITRIIKASTKTYKKQSETKQIIDYKLDAEFAKNKGKLPWPAEGPIVEKFGQRYHPIFKKVKLPFNNGINMALAPNTEIKSIFEGIVKQIVVIPGYSKCVLIQHGNYFSFYCKMGNVYVKAGDKIKTGQTIGTVETIDGITQLHFQIWNGSKPNNPELWLKP